MFRCSKKQLIAATALAALTAAPAAFATNGYFAHGYGTPNKAMGGAGAALSENAMATATNPAGMAFVGTRVDVGIALFNPVREYSTDNPGLAAPGQQSDSEYFFVPHLAYNHMLTNQHALGVALYGNGGMNTDYKNSVFFGAGGNTGVDLAQLFLAPTYAFAISPNLSLGAAVLLAYQRFEAKGLQAFASMSSDPANLTNNGQDTSTGVGIRAGVQWKVGGGVTLGAAYTPMINMSEFDKYSGLFADKGDFDIPSNYTVGIAWKGMPNLLLTFDYQRINYEDVPSVSNPGPPDAGVTPDTLLGLKNGLGFGWKNINVYKLGAAYKINNWTLRAGYNKGDNPIDKDDVLFNILAPGVITDHVTLGFGWDISPNSELSLSYMRGLENSVKGRNPAFSGGGTTEIRMYQNELEVSYSYKF